MEFIAELAVELLGEFFIEGGVKAASSRRLPGWARMLILTGLGLLFSAVFVLILLVGICALRELPLLSLVLFALDAAWIFSAFRKLRKILRTFPRQ